jgi:ankyrin repeat protein
MASKRNANRAADPVAVFFTAAKTGDAAAVRACLRDGVTVDVRMPAKLRKPFGPARETALMVAAGTGLDAVVALLLQEGADPNAQDEVKQSALFHAVRANKPAIVKRLLEAGADPNLRNRDKEIVLSHAASPNVDPKITKLLIAHGADVNAAATHGRRTLHIAAYRGNLAVAKLLLDAGADIDAANDHHGGPLTCAILHRQGKMAEYLLQRGADPRQQPEALGLAAWEGMLKTVRKLLAAGFDPNSRAWQGRTPLQHARNRKHRKVVEVLLAAGGKE